MKGRCSKCGKLFTFSIEEEELSEAGFLPEPICDDCFEDSECNDEGFEYMGCSDADSGL
jgi:hypothetical protein